MCCADCVNRRQFLALAAGGAAAVALSSCGDGIVSGVVPRTSTPTGGGNTPPGTPPTKTLIVVGNFPELATPNVLVQIPSSSIAVKRTGTATFVAYSMICTHQGCPTSLVNNAFECPCHGSRFNSNGAVTTGPANSPLETLPTSYDAATDTLTID